MGAYEGVLSRAGFLCVQNNLQEAFTMKFIATAKTKKAAQSAKRYYLKQGIPVFIKAQDGQFVLLVSDDFVRAAYGARSGRLAR